MSETQDIFLRAHTVVVNPKKAKKGKRRGSRPRRSPEKWPGYAVVFDCETRIDAAQGLTFGFYRVLRLDGDSYQLEEEGAFYDDDLPVRERDVLDRYISTAETEVKSFPPLFPLHPRSEFVKRVFYRHARKGALIVGFNLPFDLTRLARSWSEGKKNEWSLVLVRYKDGNENLHFPRILIDPIDSKKSFIRFTTEWISETGRDMPTAIGDSRFLDLRTLLFALFNQALSLKKACELASTTADDADDCNDLQRLEEPSRVGRIPSVQFLLAPGFGRRWIPGECRPRTLSAGCAVRIRSNEVEAF